MGAKPTSKTKPMTLILPPFKWTMCASSGYLLRLIVQSEGSWNGYWRHCRSDYSMKWSRGRLETYTQVPSSRLSPWATWLWHRSLAIVILSAQKFWRWLYWLDSGRYQWWKFLLTHLVRTAMRNRRCSHLSGRLQDMTALSTEPLQAQLTEVWENSHRWF